jgi:hypothetical protein
VSTGFTAILQRAVDRVPGAVGAIFAAWDGEAVDHFASGTDRDEMLVLAAHYGIVFNHVQQALHLFHFGEAEEIILMHDRLDLLVRAVAEGYYLLLAVQHGKGQTHLATALREVDVAAVELRREMA